MSQAACRTAAAALRQVADDYENKAYRRACGAGHQYDTEDPVPAAYCPMTAVYLTIHAIPIEDAKELIRQPQEAQGDHPIWRRIENAATADGIAALFEASKALLAVSQSAPALSATPMELNDRRFAGPDKDAEAVAWLRAAADHLDRPQLQEAA